ncbi:hypothetical protein BKA57DRAFT_510900 [Linnemannia elongata]|nr:hypothetical protein BKA57DRAFT_510900 [Linnemannia elongata]
MNQQPYHTQIAIPMLRPPNSPHPSGTSPDSQQLHERHQQYQHGEQQQVSLQPDQTSLCSDPGQQYAHQQYMHQQPTHGDNQSAIPSYGQAGYQSSSLQFSGPELPPTPRSPVQLSFTCLSASSSPNLLISAPRKPQMCDPSSSALLERALIPPPQASKQQGAIAAPSSQYEVNTAATSQGNSQTCVASQNNTFPKSSSNKRKKMASPIAGSLTQGKKRCASVPASLPTLDVTETVFEDGSEREDWLVARLQDPSIFLPLRADKTHPREGRMRSKADVYRQLAEEFNKMQFEMPHSGRFYGTTPNGNGIKTKIKRIQTTFMTAHNLRGSSGYGATDSESWKTSIMKECRYYFDLFPIWGQKWSDGIVFYADSMTDLTDDRITDDPPQGDFDSDAGTEAEEDQRDESGNERRSSPSWEDVPDSDDVGPEEEEDEPLVRRRRLPAPATPVTLTSTARPSTATSQRNRYRQQQRMAADGGGWRPVFKYQCYLSEATRMSAQLEYQKAEIQERIRMKEIESSLKEKEMALKEKEMDFKLRLEEIEARKAEAIARVQAEKELALERERWMSKRDSPGLLLPSSPRRRTPTGSPKNKSPSPNANRVDVHLTIILDIVILKIRTMSSNVLTVTVIVTAIIVAVATITAIITAALVVRFEFRV